MAQPTPGSAESLYQDPTASYAPALADIANQEAIANQRYAQNKADLTNIFGSLSTLSAADSARIQEQFKTTIAEQQAGLAARTAEARTGVAKNIEAVKTVGAERGQGPAMIGSPVATEAEAGIGRANAYQQTWEGLLGANKTQAAADTVSRQQGYALQQQEALTSLNRMLQDRLTALGQQRTGLQGQLAQAQMSGKQTVLNAKYQEAQAALARQRAAAAASAAAANQPRSYSSGIVGIDQRMADDAGIKALGTNAIGANQLQSELTDAYNALADQGNAKPSKQQILVAWQNANSGSPQRKNALLPYVMSVLDLMY